MRTAFVQAGHTGVQRVCDEVEVCLVMGVEGEEPFKRIISVMKEVHENAGWPGRSFT